MADDDSTRSHWSGSGKLRGGRWAILFFITVLRVLGLRVTYVLAAPVAAFFSLVSPDVPATMDYHRRIYGPLPAWKRRWMVFRHFYSFGRALIDRQAVLGGMARKFSFEFEGEHYLREELTGGNGLLLLTGHLGNWEAAGHLLARLKVPVNVIGYDKESPEVRALLNRVSRATFRLLPLTGSATDTIPVLAALRRGEVVAMLGDRAYQSSAVRVPFLGGTAVFPVGAYVMASVAGASLVHVFNLREAGGHYHCFGFPPQRPRLPPRASRDEYLKGCAMRFARDLEWVLRRDPLQWYNFFPFWAEPVSTPRDELERNLCTNP